MKIDKPPDVCTVQLINGIWGSFFSIARSSLVLDMSSAVCLTLAAP
jgi:hypothetical protein